MRLRIADGVSDSGSGNSTTGALGDEPPSRFAIGGTSRECSVALSPSAMKWRLLATRHLPQLPLSARRTHDFELASFYIGSGPALHFDNTFLENDDPQAFLPCMNR
jgi:hypothetical protein